MLKIGADSVPLPKPNPDGLIECFRVLNLVPEQCIYIGDSPSDGIASRRAGCFSIGVSYGSHKRENLLEYFDIVVDTVSELKTLLLLKIQKIE